LGVIHSRRSRAGDALTAHDRAIAIRERLVAGGRRDLENKLAGSYLNRATALHELGDASGALVALKAAAAIRERLVAAGATELRLDLVRTLSNLGGQQVATGDATGAISTLRRARTEVMRMVEAEGRIEQLPMLAAICVNLSSALREVRDGVAAAEAAGF